MTPYGKLRAARPDLFVNLPDGIEILFGEDETEAAQRSVGADASEPVGIVYADQFVTIMRDAVRFPGGALGMYLRLVHTSATPGVVILPVVEPGQVVLIEHYRHATRAWHWEVPRGMGSPDTSAATDAARELREEIGAQAKELISLGDLHPDSGLLSSRVELYAARIDRTGALDTAEGIRRTLTVPWTTVEEMIATGSITDAFTIAVFTRARLAGLFTENE
ncbi:NUDIX hydrolase [Streptomyces zagrosensis]|uniref:ADP-ribose pyrophosphatase n=1 Tax=Streptomyces zagrosensis TaxID=1042984 RepID=A0A7W9V1G1_9ACTN|nr:NUDIX hydrolase [Streptomyces zagrosensis]MBB5939258.1 ADP-ribose pyrophosphatase [Streptomyces zagrosensis]